MTRHQQVHKYTVKLIPTGPDGYSVHVPALPGVVTSGGTVEEALAMAREAITLQMEGLREDGIAIPVEPPKRGRRPVRVPIEVAA
jgi:predicted RNase H-like HicB family nuclease